jgi:hypothetical protein
MGDELSVFRAATEGGILRRIFAPTFHRKRLRDPAIGAGGEKVWNSHARKRADKLNDALPYGCVLFLVSTLHVLLRLPV